ncbi:hypothetical protein BC940DRAFT_304255 [Gongronella butleri]|nr:hypothetical protein BC940DRAFT_304255 [Gongronella butleri]
MRLRSRYNERSYLLAKKKQHADDHAHLPFTASLLIATFVPAMGGLLYGLDNALIQILLAAPSFRHVSASSVVSWETLTFGYHALLLLGIWHAAHLCDAIGRTRCLGWAYGVFAMANGLMVLQNDEMALLLVARWMIGWSCGMMLVVCPCMILELAPADLRACLVGFFALLMLAGQLTAQVLYVAVGDTTMTSNTRKALAALELDDIFFFVGIVALLLACITFRLPDAPLWLAHQRKNANDGIHALAFVLDRPADDPFVQQQWKRLNDRVNDETDNEDDDSPKRFFSFLGHLLTKQRSPLRASCTLVLAAQMLGADAWVRDYAPALLYAAGLLQPHPAFPDQPLPPSPVLSLETSRTNDPMGANIAYTNPRMVDTTSLALSLAAMAISLGWFVDHVNRRSLLSIGAFLLSLCQWAVGLLVYIGGLVDITTGTLMLNPQMRPVLLTFLYFFIAVYAFTWKSAWLVTCTERFTTRHRARGIAAIVLLHCLLQWLAQACPPWHQWYTPSFIYFFYGTTALVTSYAISLSLPNTSGVSLENIAQIA